MQMIRFGAWSALFGALFVIGGCCSPRPTNLSEAKDAVVRYYENGCFRQELALAAERARRFFRKPATHDRQVVVSDIDETVLSEYCNMKSIQFGYVPKLSHAWVERACAPAFPEMKELYDYILAQGYHVIFLTGRQHNEYEATKRNLEQQGFTGFDRLIVRSPEQSHLKAQEYKAAERTKLVQEGYEIVACMGDQWSDLTGPYVGRAIKVPNYIYMIA